MANNSRRSRPSATPGGSAPVNKAPRGATPAPTARRPGNGDGGGDASSYLVPGLLAVLVGGAVLWHRASSQTPAEPAAPPVELGAPAPSAPAAREPVRREPEPPPAAAPSAPAPAPAQAENVAITPVHPEPTSPDPQRGNFSLAKATAGMPAGTRLVAEIETSMGTFTCDLWPDRAPITVANFVGLARGTRDFWDPVAGRWTKRPYYDGTVFHRVIPDFMIQGGDILRSGQGGPGYTIRDENVANHDEPGLLAMANRGPNTGGSQFFILEDPKPHLNGSYSVFGRCAPLDLAERIARVPRTPRDQPLTPVRINHIRIRR